MDNINEHLYTIKENKSVQELNKQLKDTRGFLDIYKDIKGYPPETKQKLDIVFKALVPIALNNTYEYTYEDVFISMLNKLQKLTLNYFSNQKLGYVISEEDSKQKAIELIDNLSYVGQIYLDGKDIQPYCEGIKENNDRLFVNKVSRLEYQYLNNLGVDNDPDAHLYKKKKQTEDDKFIHENLKLAALYDNVDKDLVIELAEKLDQQFDSLAKCRTYLNQADLQAIEIFNQNVINQKNIK